MDTETANSVVLEALTQACSQDASILKPAEQQLQIWETQPGFYTTLVRTFSNYDIDVSVRFLAVVYFKNVVDRYWRKTAPNAISEEEKVAIKQHLIAKFDEPVNQIAIQLAVLIGKISRLDCPRYWPELIPQLLEAVKFNDILIQQRALLTLHHVVKTFASKRLLADRKIFEQLTLSIFEFLLSLWTSTTEQFVLALQSGNVASALQKLDHSHLSLKVLRKLLVFGFHDTVTTEAPLNFVKLVFQRLDQFIKAKCDMQVSRDLMTKREKIITLLTKVLLDLQEYHPEYYIQFIQPSLEYCVRYNFQPDCHVIVYERLLVNNFNIMRNILRCEKYRPAKVIEETKNPATLEAWRLKMTFFTTEMLTEIINRLILQYFPLTAEDLQTWDSDPEDFAADEGGDSWKFSLRPCTENLYLTLLKEFRNTVTPLILQLVTEYQSAIDPSNLEAVLRKDAVYNALGLASFDFYDEVDFDVWFSSHLLDELQNTHPNCRILRRRVVWLTGCWVGVKMSTKLRPVVYQTILPLLHSQEDLVIRLEAALTLRHAVDDFDFTTDQFLPYLDSSFGALFQLLKDVSECETKMQVLNVMSYVIERMTIKIRPHAGALIQYLPSLWQESEDHDMLRCAILTTLTVLVQGLGGLCVEMFDFLLPVIQLSTDVNKEPHVYLCEDGLDLWLNTLYCTNTLTPDLLNLYANMPHLLEKGTETLKLCLKIVETYILLEPKQFLQKWGTSIVKSLTNLVTDLRSEGVLMIYKVFEISLRTWPEETPVIFMSMLPQIYCSVLDGKEVSPMVLCVQMSLIARIILQNSNFIQIFLQHLSQDTSMSSADLLEQYIDTVINRSANLVHVERRKLCAMALASLLSSNSRGVLERFGIIVTFCVETLHDVCKTEFGSNLLIDSLVEIAEETPVDELDNEHDRRKKELSGRDPVHCVSLKDYMMTVMNTCKQQYGPDTFNQLMELVDSEISLQLQEFLK